MAEGALARFLARRKTAFPPLTAFAIAGLPEPAHVAATIIWQRRHANEQASVHLGERMQAQVRSLAFADADVGQALARLTEDERAHEAAAATVLAALGAPFAAPQAIRAPTPDEPPALSFARDAVVGLAICESVSAARFATVRAATDIPIFQKIVQAFLRDEVAHAALGFCLVPVALRALATQLGQVEASRWILHEFLSALGELENIVGLDGARRGLAPPRPQPTQNPGIVEPNLDAHAFYRAVETRILPRLDRCGLLATHAWTTRFDR